MLENRPDNQRNTNPDTIDLTSLGYTSNQVEVLKALTLNAISAAGLPELEKAIELAVEWPKTNRAFTEISKTLLEHQDASMRGFKSRLCMAYAETLDQMSGQTIDGRSLTNLLRLMKGASLAIETLTLTDGIREVDDFQKLPYAILHMVGVIFDPHYSGCHMYLKREVIDILSREILPALEEAEIFDWSLRRELARVARIIYAQEDFSETISKDGSEGVNYLLSIFDLAQVAQSKALLPRLIETTEYLFDLCRSSQAAFNQEKRQIVPEVLLASAVSALSASGDSPRSREIIDEIYEQSEILSAPWNEAFLALSRLDLGTTYASLRQFVDEVLKLQSIESDLALLKYLRIPGGDRAVSVELRSANSHYLVEELALRYQRYFDGSAKHDRIGLTQDRETLSEVFRGLGVGFKR